MNRPIKESKIKEVESIRNLLEKYSVIGIADISSLPASQLQSIKFKLKPEIVTIMSKKRLVKIALNEIKDKNNIQELGNHLQGIPFLIFSEKDSFRLSKFLRKNRSNAPAKPGQIAPIDILIPAGPTNFTPGPIIGELGQLGLKTGVEGGKIAIKEEKLVAKEGEEINEKTASVLAKLGIEPMKIGLNLIATYDNGIIFTKNQLDIDEDKYLDNLKKAASDAFNLSIGICFLTKENTGILLAKTVSEAQALSSQIGFDNLLTNMKEEFSNKETVPKEEISEQTKKEEEIVETVVENISVQQESIEEQKVDEENNISPIQEELNKEEKKEIKVQDNIEKETQIAQDILKKLQDKKMEEPLLIGPKKEKPINKGPKPEDLIRR